MEIYVVNKKLEKILSDRKKMIRKYGFNMAQKIMQRIHDMKVVENLAVLMDLPGNHHSLKGDRKGQFACDLEHSYRLIYRPGNNPLPINENGMLIYSEITIINILEIKDYILPSSLLLERVNLSKLFPLF